ncbi:MAG: hypothetical protein COA96_03095 [SAR86 cluster bacterium]|uniref:Uncharacterized protein n=1 Tax=SAR86 cluster bacterium TaxID=2030880 RepID=A0A2A5B811_9GAMM|nr:MAG: hypothetical protein COA96_03095 [SAR86 cluster bacterium]
MIKTVAFASLMLPFAIASAQESALTESDRYFDISSFTLYEPCLTFESVSYKARFMLDDRGEEGLYWVVINGEEISKIPDDCEAVHPSVFTSDPTIPFVSYNLENLIIADGNTDTGLRYDIASRADNTRFDLGFSFDYVRELRKGESIFVSGTGAMSFPGPNSFPFEWHGGAFQSVTTNYTFDGSLEYNVETNTFIVSFDSTNEAGDYTLTVIFRDLASNQFELLVVYPIEFHVI